MVNTLHRDAIFVLLYRSKYKTKSEKITNRDLGKIFMVCLVALVLLVGHSTNSVGVRGYSG